jgi:spermidine synthase
MAGKLKHIIESTYSYVTGRVIEQTQSEINPCLEVAHRNGKYMLKSEKAIYSYGTHQKVFEEEFRKIKLKDRKIEEVLILGFGAGAIASTLLNKYKMKCNVTGVEKDSQVIDLGWKYFDLHKLQNTEIYCSDAYDFMMDNHKLFDLIIVDVYIDKLVPEKIETANFLCQLRNSLKNKGLIIFNKLVFDKDSDLSSKKLYDTFSKVMGRIVYHKVQRHYTNLMLVYEKNSPVHKASKPSLFQTLHNMF